MAALSEVTLAILAGGESSRMGRPKARLDIDGKPILRWMLERFAWPGPTVLVVSPGHENPPGHELFISQVCDPAARQGPLRGVLTALENFSTSLLAIVTVDMPGIEQTHLSSMIQAIDGRDDLSVLMPSRLLGGKVQAEPFPSVWRAQSIETVRSQLAKGDMSVKALGKIKGAALILAPRDWSASVWTNLNTPEELERFIAERR
jgi:molybdopterin-guanine dinucleotide biosynthesis protein A